MKKILLFGLIAIGLMTLVLGAYALTQFDTIPNSANVIVWVSTGVYTWTTLDAVLNTDLIVVDSSANSPHYAQFDSLLNTDNIIVEDATYDADGILETPLSVPTRYESTTLTDGVVELEWTGTYWVYERFEEVRYSLTLVDWEGAPYYWRFGQGEWDAEYEQYFYDYSYKYIGQTPEGDYEGEFSATISIV